MTKEFMAKLILNLIIDPASAIGTICEREFVKEV